MNEFSLINKYLKPLCLKNSGAFNLSDDVYFDSKKRLSISLDTFVEGIHFIDPHNPNKFLKRILRASLSDLYCKGILPKYYFLSFSLNHKFAKPSWFKKIQKILASEQKKFNIVICGGDTTLSSKLVISVFVYGYNKNNPILRKKCNFNDDIYVTGNIGDSYLGLCVLQKKFDFGKYNLFYKKKYFEPEIQTKFSQYLSKFATSSIDISDGLAQDLKHLCKNSKCGALIDLNLLPLSFFTKNLIKKKKVHLTKIFSKGDDYQILFTSQFKNRSKIINLSKKLRVKISRIGLIKKSKELRFKYNMKFFKLNPDKMGYTHHFN